MGWEDVVLCGKREGVMLRLIPLCHDCALTGGLQATWPLGLGVGRIPYDLATKKIRTSNDQSEGCICLGLVITCSALLIEKGNTSATWPHDRAVVHDGRACCIVIHHPSSIIHHRLPP